MTAHDLSDLRFWAVTDRPYNSILTPKRTSSVAKDPTQFVFRYQPSRVKIQNTGHALRMGTHVYNRPVLQETAFYQ